MAQDSQQPDEGTEAGAADSIPSSIQTLADPDDDDRDLAPLGAGGLIQRKIRDEVRAQLFNRTPAKQRIGRYVVLERIGRGGMGTVFAAYDEQLDRKVAVKVLSAHGGVSETAQLRLRREAQAMARLSHSNVATVHEVGQTEGELYIAMEFIRGQSLDSWIATKPEWRAVIEVFVAAGRGLVAAHDSGIVHRDLKPHNIMRSDDGVVKVLDFGLARAEGEAWSKDEPQDGPVTRDSSDSALEIDLTRTGAVMGTPAYMAPEQHMGAVADARSDQYSFCVALYEALYGRLPFEAPTLVALIHNIQSKALRPPPSGSPVPSWVFRVVSRGLSLSTDDRWPSVRALLEALERDPARKRRRWSAVAGVAVAAGLAGFGLSELRADSDVACQGAKAHRERLWPKARRAAVVEAFEASGSRLAADTASRVTGQVDATVEAWAQMRREACQANREGRQSARIFDARMACLDSREAGIEQLLAAFEAADTGTVENAAWAVASLPSIERCGDVESLTAAVPPPEDPQVAQRVQALRERMARANALVLTGAAEEAIAGAREVLDQAAELDYPPLRAEAELTMGTVFLEAHQHQSSYDMLTRAVDSGLRWGHDEVIVEALGRRMWVVSDPLRRPDEGMHDAEIARPVLDKLGRPRRLTWLMLNNHGATLFRAGRLQDSERSYRQALEVAGGGDGPQLPVELISTRWNLAMLLSNGLGSPAAAVAELSAARDQAAELLGSEHPRVRGFAYHLADNLVTAGRHTQAIDELESALTAIEPAHAYLRGLHLVELARVYSVLRRYDEALEAASDAVSLAEAQFPDDHLASVSRWNRGIARIGRGQVEPGITDLERAVAEERERMGPEHEFVATAHWWAGYGLLQAERRDEAIVQLERARTLFAELGPSYLGRQSFLLIDAYVERGDLPAAETLVDEAIAAQDEAGFPADNEHRAQIRMHRAELRLAQGRMDDAKADFEFAQRMFERAHEPDDPLVARCLLGQARVAGGGSQGRALAQRAVAIFQALGEGFAAERAEAEALLVPSP